MKKDLKGLESDVRAILGAYACNVVRTPAEFAALLNDALLQRTGEESATRLWEQCADVTMAEVR